ncbi:hypothetical protein ACUOA8_48370, partial [Escherichia sp. SS-MK2]
YLNLYGFLRDIYQMPGIAETVNFDHAASDMNNMHLANYQRHLVRCLFLTEANISSMRFIEILPWTN